MEITSSSCRSGLGTAGVAEVVTCCLVLSDCLAPCVVQWIWKAKKLNKGHMAALGAVMVLPGGCTVALGGIGVKLLIESVRQQSSGDEGPWQLLHARCLQKADAVVRQKMRPIEVRYVNGPAALQSVKICLFSITDTICVVPIGGFGGRSTTCLSIGDQCLMQPPGECDRFRLRVYRPAMLDVALHDGVEVCRNERISLTVLRDGRVVSETSRREGNGDRSAVAVKSPDAVF